MNKIIQWNIRGAMNCYYLSQNTAQQSYASKKLTSKTTPPLT